MNSTFVCLANSRKNSGRCIAGKEIGSSHWIRPVSNRITEEISEIEMRYENGIIPKLLDIVKFEIIEKKPNRFQVENYLLDPKYYWTKTGEFEPSRLGELCDDSSKMWPNLVSSYQGINDRAPSSICDQYAHSLVLLELEESKIIVRTEGAEFNNPKRKVRFQFAINTKVYLLPVTDPEIERSYLAKPNNEYIINGTHYATISMGLPHSDAFCYIFAAGIICDE